MEKFFILTLMVSTWPIANSGTITLQGIALVDNSTTPFEVYTKIVADQCDKLNVKPQDAAVMFYALNDNTFPSTP